ncbi:hypothetical protein [Bradyrhizobium cenepequi]
MTRSMSGRWIERVEVSARRLAAQYGQLAAGPELHVTTVIVRATKQARMHRARAGAAAAGPVISRAER